MPKYNYSQYQNIPVSIEVTVGEVKDLVYLASRRQRDF